MLAIAVPRRDTPAPGSLTDSVIAPVTSMGWLMLIDLPANRLRLKPLAEVMPAVTLMLSRACSTTLPSAICVTTCPAVMKLVVPPAAKPKVAPGPVLPATAPKSRLVPLPFTSGSVARS